MWSDFRAPISIFLSHLSKKAEKIFGWLVEKEYIFNIFNYINQKAIPAAIDFCAEKTGFLDICSNLIGELVSFVNNYSNNSKFHWVY